jgi:hypothetical protein
VSKALEAPIRQIVENAGVEVSIMVGRLLEKSGSYGFDAQKEEYVGVVVAGIIDPTKVVRVALQNAASVASPLITTEAMIVDQPETPAETPGFFCLWAVSCSGHKFRRIMRRNCAHLRVMVARRTVQAGHEHSDASQS